MYGEDEPGVLSASKLKRKKEEEKSMQLLNLNHCVKA